MKYTSAVLLLTLGSAMGFRTLETAKPSPEERRQRGLQANQCSINHDAAQSLEEIMVQVDPFPGYYSGQGMLGGVGLFSITVCDQPWAPPGECVTNPGYCIDYTRSIGEKQMYQMDLFSIYDIDLQKYGGDVSKYDHNRAVDKIDKIDNVAWIINNINVGDVMKAGDYPADPTCSGPIRWTELQGGIWHTIDFENGGELNAQGNYLDGNGAWYFKNRKDCISKWIAWRADNEGEGYQIDCTDPNEEIPVVYVVDAADTHGTGNGDIIQNQVIMSETKVWSIPGFCNCDVSPPPTTPRPTSKPTMKPSVGPTFKPTAKPTGMPTNKPTAMPTPLPTAKPTGSPTAKPTAKPTTSPTAKPTQKPTPMPTVKAGSPTMGPTERPTAKPTTSPTAKPTASPTAKPTASPTAKPTAMPTPGPTESPTESPTEGPTSSPSAKPTPLPTAKPTASPTAKPTAMPTPGPTEKPTASPTAKPTASPTAKPTEAPTEAPTASPTTLHPTPPPKSPTSAPSEAPTSSPTASPTEPPTPPPVTGFPAPPKDTPAPAPTPTPASGSGDPHFKTWSGDKFDYHGECDLVLVHNPSFGDGIGMYVHIRTTRVKYFSYIESIAIKMGNSVLEFDNDVSNFMIDGKKVGAIETHKETRFAGFMVRRDPKAVSIRLEQDSRAKIDLIQRANGFPAVIMDGGDDHYLFEGSLGLLGDWATGKRMARDGKTEMMGEDATEYALEWQVRDTDPQLFQKARFPQYPQQCTPPKKMMGNRLGLSHMKEEAEKACAHWKDDMDDCIFDVIATRDVLVAAEGSISSTV